LEQQTIYDQTKFMLVFDIKQPEPDQGHLSLPPPKIKLGPSLLPNFPKHWWFQNVILNVWRNNLQ